MIKSFRHKGIAAFWNEGDIAKLDARMAGRIKRILDALDASMKPQDMHLPGFRFHSLLGFDPTRYAVSVNGPWRITFAFVDGHAEAVDLEQYH